MVLSLGLTLFSLLLVWVALAALVGYEERVGSRVVFSGMRSRMDASVVWVVTVIAATLRYIDRHIIRLSWYYSLHSFLQAALRVVVSLYDYLEQWFHLNRKRTRALRAERRTQKVGSGAKTVPATVLTRIAEHKENVALTEKQKQKLKTKLLERG